MSGDGQVYLVDERSDGMVGSYRQSEGRWQRTSSVPTRGDEPCYLALEETRGLIAAANYGSGSVALFELAGDGELSTASVHTNSGRGPDPERQAGPHAHCAIFGPDGRLYRTDLGTDEVLAQRIDQNAGLGAPEVVFRAPPGAGPRHLVFHPSLPVAYLLCELSAQIVVLDTAGPLLRDHQTLRTAPTDFAGGSLGGHLAVDAAGERLYASNRGHDSLVIFAIDREGLLSVLGRVPSDGASPRFFLLLEDRRMLVLINEQASNIVAFAIGLDGVPAPLGQAIGIPGAAFVFRG